MRAPFDRFEAPPRRPRPAAAPFLSLLLALAAGGCGEEPATEEAVARPIKMLEIGGASSVGTREYPGTVEAAQRAELGFEVPGQLSEFPVLEGQQVEEGAVLAKLDPRDYQTRLDSARAERDNARANLDRALRLFEQEVLPAVQRDQQKTRYEVAEAAFREAEKALEDTTLRAPFAGLVARKLVDDRQNVRAKQPVVLLQDESSLEIKVAIPERDVAGGRARRSSEEIEARLHPRVVVTSLPDRAFPARVKEFATAADPVTRTFEATLAFENPQDVRILPGMTAKVVIDLPAEPGGAAAIAIPASAAIADDEGRAYVWRVDPSSMTVSRTPVQLGELSGSEVAVRGGLSAGDLIAISGVHQLREGMAVSRLGN